MLDTYLGFRVSFVFMLTHVRVYVPHVYTHAETLDCVCVRAYRYIPCVYMFPYCMYVHIHSICIYSIHRTREHWNSKVPNQERKEKRLASWASYRGSFMLCCVNINF